MSISKKMNLCSIVLVTMATAVISVVLIIKLQSWANDEIAFFRRTVLATEKTKLKGLVDSVVSLLQAEYKAKKGKLKPAELRRHLLSLVRPMRYGPAGKDYFFIQDLNLKMVMHPINPKLDGTDMSGFKDATGKLITVAMVKIARQKGAGFDSYMWPKPGQKRPLPKLSYVKLFRPLGWVVGTGLYIDQIDTLVATKRANVTRQMVSMIIFAVIIALILIGLGIGFSLLFSRKMTRPIKQIVEVSEAIAGGDFSQQITHESRDEIGRMAQGLRDMLTGVIGQSQSIREGIVDPFFTVDNDMRITHINHVAEKMIGKTNEEVMGKVTCHELFQAESCGTPACMIKKAMSTGQPVVGEKTFVTINGRRTPIAVSASVLTDLDDNVIGGMEVIRDITADVEAENRIKQQQQDLLAVAGEVSQMAEMLASAATEISASTEEMSASTNQQSAQAETVATTVQEMSATVHQVATNSADGAEEARKAGEIAGQGGSVVEQTIESMNQINQDITEVGGTVQDLATKSEEIDQVVAVIEDIADQTNLLALNAAIEAARAGEAGRGFAVVADEVRKLAEKTMGATKEVGITVQSIKDSTEQTVDRVRAAQENVGRGVDLAGTAGQMLKQIVANADQVSQMVAQIATAVEEQTAATEEISRNVEGIATGTRESANAVGETARAAEELSDLASRLNETVARFKGNV